jgi:hypothetical protein
VDLLGFPEATRLEMHWTLDPQSVQSPKGWRPEVDGTADERVGKQHETQTPRLLAEYNDKMANPIDAKQPMRLSSRKIRLLLLHRAAACS